LVCHFEVSGWYNILQLVVQLLVLPFKCQTPIVGDSDLQLGFPQLLQMQQNEGNEPATLDSTGP
jgi:hypothetical protein